LAPDEAGNGLKFAALEGGYAYRLSTSSFAVIGLVGPAYKGIGGVSDLRTILAEAKAEWLLSGVDLASACKQVSRIASMQWSVHRGTSRSVLSIGDAAQARDALAAEGWALSIADVLYAIAATRDEFGADLLRARQVEQRTAHIKHLVGAIRHCAFRNSTAWRDYLDWLLEISSGPARKVALRDGRIATAVS
jgi:2-polyprenyl-6-methoxyphenol hydroxylase-like FAD-dependent oxidoreductase